MDSWSPEGFFIWVGLIAVHLIPLLPFIFYLRRRSLKLAGNWDKGNKPSQKQIKLLPKRASLSEHPFSCLPRRKDVLHGRVPTQTFMAYTPLVTCCPQGPAKPISQAQCLPCQSPPSHVSGNAQALTWGASSPPHWKNESLWLSHD